jgi:hypothetical protein
MSRRFLFSFFSFLASLSALAAGCRCGPPPPSPCSVDADCEDGLYCTIGARCLVDGTGRGTCAPPAGSPCLAGERCDEAARRCRPCTSGPDCILDGGTDDAGLTCEDRVPGTACSGGFCGAAECHAQITTELAPTVRRDGSPGRPLPVRFFPDGYCSVRCDAGRLNDECGTCARCIPEGMAGSERFPLYFASSSYSGEGVCRERCTPSPTSTGCSRPGYTCDPETGTCMESCVDDRQCQIVYEDVDGDGTPELVDRGEPFPAYCDRTTGRCRTRGTLGARIGDRCIEDSDCADDGHCLKAPGATEGVCTQLGCRAAGFECPPGSACDLRNAGEGRSACLIPCEVGAEDGTPAMRGSRTGGHPACGLGRSCSWNGVSEPGDPLDGSCVGGQYNDRTTPAVGAPCRTAADCDSPFGYGECLFDEWTPFVGSGICTVHSCGRFVGASGETVDGLLPGVEIARPICDSALGQICMPLGSRALPAQTYCLETCADASTCAPGYACLPILVSSTRFCWPYCFEPGDCRAGAVCQSPGTGEACGPADGYCLCSDAVPAPP